MLRPQNLDRIRSMTIAEKFDMVVQMTNEGIAAMHEGSADVVERRFQLIHRQNEERNRLICDGLARLRNRK